MSLDTSFSSIKVIKYGIALDSILGHIHFLIYIKDLPNVSSIIQFYIYADDASILHRNSDLNSLVNVVKQEFPKITEWLASNKLKVNANKSASMPFHPRQKIINTDDIIKIINTTVPFSISTIFLGIHIDYNLTLNVHIKHINTTISKYVGVH